MEPRAGPGRDAAEVGWVSDDPHLSGSFAPVGREVDVADLPVVAGRIPKDLSGVYMRNGPNPLFKPLSYTYPLDGDGMIHAVYLDNGRAHAALSGLASLSWLSQAEWKEAKCRASHFSSWVLRGPPACVGCCWRRGWRMNR
jgi:Retinal pigment epithelial membrane protein